MFCRECGEELEEIAKYCSKCGTRQLKKEIPEPVFENKLSMINKNIEVLDPNIKFHNLFEVYRDGNFSFAPGYIVSSFFSKTTSYSIYEVVSYKSLNGIYLTTEGFQLAVGGKRLHIIVEPQNYYYSYQDPFNRSKINGEYAPLHLNELEIIISNNQTKIMMAKKPIEYNIPYTVLEPKGSNFVVVFYQLADMFASIANFFMKSLKEQGKVVENDAREASQRIAAKIEKGMNF
jgi:hypothetical protein